MKRLTYKIHMGYDMSPEVLGGSCTELTWTYKNLLRAVGALLDVDCGSKSEIPVRSIERTIQSLAQA